MDEKLEIAAASQYPSHMFPVAECCHKREGFMAGAKWQREQSPWISVEDRMPEDEQLVLTSSSIYGIKLLVWNNYYKVWDDEDGDDIYCEQDKIDAWMPIPE